VKAGIAVLPGDGIGPEVIAQGVRCLRAVAEAFGHELTLTELPFGGAAIDRDGDPLPESTLQACLAADAVLLGAIGGPKWSAPEAKVRPEQALLGLRKALGVYANLRPVKVHPALLSSSTLKPEIIDGVDLVFVRELTGGIYFGDKRRDARSATDVCTYAVEEIERIVRVAARLAMSRRRKLVSIDKSNVLETSRLWREVTTRVVRTEFLEVTLEHMLVDSAAMHLIRRPRDFDVLVTENMFGDILTDEASMLAGSLGLLPSASLGEGTRGLYEPIHGSAPDIAGQGIANPCGMILSVALLLRHSLGLESEAAAIEQAVSQALERGARTPDIAGERHRASSTREVGNAVLSVLRRERPDTVG
jgi:3-isopropylmalate dehydrogenase